MFPLHVADRLRAEGIELEPQHELFDLRRRPKRLPSSPGSAAPRPRPTRGWPRQPSCSARGGPLTSEEIKAAIDAAFMAHGCSCDEFIVSHGAQSAIGHHVGSGEIAPGEPVVIDIWPRDRESACFADMTRTFVVGEPTDELVEWHRLVKEALDRSLELIRPGVSGPRGLRRGAARSSRPPGTRPSARRSRARCSTTASSTGSATASASRCTRRREWGSPRNDVLQAGDVVTVEPGLYRPGTGGCRLEDLVVVTDDGYENLTRFPYELQP